ncbi:MAG: hypothetical protein GOMPHAMPRED_002094 [Gomphillus americanus]|uniref:Methyltransferase type 11 domain-containing protein n=1 Tax=Gomphillus americanus TaxID=1940652 RepID=A0A8H3FDF1_9LECA|nr:MAG: hypothetical protein GOMPHAMPRED_002094 [Gomphillus americanus]
MSFSSVPSETRIVFTNEQVTGPPAREMIRLAGINESSIVLDNATGGGVAALAAKAKYAADINDSMLALAKSRGLNTLKADQTNLPLDSATFTHITNSFGVFFSADDNVVLKETHRLLVPGGIAGFTSWKSIGWWADVAPHMPLPLPSHPESLFPAKWNEADVIREKMTRAGFGGVDVTEYSFRPQVLVKEFAEATAVLVKTIARRVWSEEDFARYGPGIEGRIVDCIKDRYENTWDGVMTALITVGRKSE